MNYIYHLTLIKYFFGRQTKRIFYVNSSSLFSFLHLFQSKDKNFTNNEKRVKNKEKETRKFSFSSSKSFFSPQSGIVALLPFERNSDLSTLLYDSSIVTTMYPQIRASRQVFAEGNNFFPPSSKTPIDKVSWLLDTVYDGSHEWFTSIFCRFFCNTILPFFFFYDRIFFHRKGLKNLRSTRSIFSNPFSSSTSFTEAERNQAPYIPIFSSKLSSRDW